MNENLISCDCEHYILNSRSVCLTESVYIPYRKNVLLRGIIILKLSNPTPRATLTPSECVEADNHLVILKVMTNLISNKIFHRRMKDIQRTETRPLEILGSRRF